MLPGESSFITSAINGSSIARGTSFLKDRLGQAIASSPIFAEHGINIAAVFDRDVEKVGHRVGDLVVSSTGEIQDLVRQRLSQHEYPRQIEFVAELPKTTTGKIQRFKLGQEIRT